MAKKTLKDSDIHDDSGNWNSAKRFSDSKIMSILESLDTYEIRAERGFSSDEEIIKNHKLDEDKLGYIKFCAFKMLVSKMIQLINNSRFAIKNKKDISEGYLEKLKIINESFIPELEKDIIGDRLFLPEYYIIILKIVQNIKSEVNEPLNKNNLIFMGNKVDYDPQEAKRRFFEEGGAIIEEENEENENGGSNL